MFSVEILDVTFMKYFWFLINFICIYNGNEINKQPFIDNPPGNWNENKPEFDPMEHWGKNEDVVPSSLKHSEQPPAKKKKGIYQFCNTNPHILVSFLYCVDLSLFLTVNCYEGQLKSSHADQDIPMECK